MQLENFKYKPRCITQISENDLKEVGVDFVDILKKMVSSKYDSIMEFPPDQELRVRMSTMEKHCVRLAAFYFTVGGNYSMFVRPSIDIKFPFREIYNCGDPGVERNPYTITRSKAFPSSVDYLGYTLGNYHLNVEISDLFEEHTRHSIVFDEDGNYIPVVSTENCASPSQFIWTLRYTADDWANPVDLDKMLIPEICNAKIGKYFFWLDRFHFCKIYDNQKAFSNTTVNYRKIIEVYSMNAYDEKRTWDYNLPSCKKMIEEADFQGPFSYPRNAVRYFQSWNSIYLCDNGSYMYGHEHRNLDGVGNMATIRRLATPIEKKALELYSILNSDPARFAKQVVFPDSIRKVADAISPLVVKTVQIIRSCKSMQLEEI
jgi:hypothetical protein